MKRKLFTLIIVASAILTTFTCFNLAAKSKAKTLSTKELSGKDVILKKVLISSKPNTLSKEDMQNFIDNTLPKLIPMYKDTLKRQSKSNLDYSAFPLKSKNGKPDLTITEKDGIVKVLWEIESDATYTANMTISLSSTKGMVMVLGGVIKEDPKDPKKPFSKTVGLMYMMK